MTGRTIDGVLCSLVLTASEVLFRSLKCIGISDMLDFTAFVVDFQSGFFVMLVDELFRMCQAGHGLAQILAFYFIAFGDIVFVVTTEKFIKKAHILPHCVSFSAFECGVCYLRYAHAVPLLPAGNTRHHTAGERNLPQKMAAGDYAERKSQKVKIFCACR